MGIYTAVPATEKEKKKAARETFEKIAKFVIDTWPNKPEADDARMTLAQDALNRGDAEGALKILGEINPKSERYGVSLAISGQLLWELYVKTKKPFLEMGNKPDATAQAALDSLRKRAREKMAAAVAKLMESIGPGKPPSPQCIAAQLLYSEILLEEAGFKEAVTLLEPLVTANKPNKPGALEITTVRIFLDALRGYLGMGNVQKAGEIGKILVDGGEDNPTVNQVLVDFCRTLDKERKKAEADRIKANSLVDAKGVAEAGKRLGEYESLMGELLKRISNRRQFTPSAMRYVIELCTEVNLIDQASKLCQDLEEKAENDPNFAKYKSWVLSQKIGISRKAGKFEEAAAAAEKLVEENPKALDPRMELGRIYEDWAQIDPSKFDEAARRWAQVRNLLDPAKRRKEFAAPYYEANYHASLCMFQLAKQLLLPKDKKAAVDKATEGGKFLTASLVQAPKLSGPDMVTRYKALKEEINTFRAKNKVE
jgi:predicted Zn-dependent protease